MRFCGTYDYQQMLWVLLAEVMVYYKAWRALHGALNRKTCPQPDHRRSPVISGSRDHAPGPNSNYTIVAKL